jgi:hypothetical protein
MRQHTSGMPALLTAWSCELEPVQITAWCELNLVSSDVIILILFKLSVLCRNGMFCSTLYSLHETEVFLGRTIEKHCCIVKRVHE